MPDIREHTTATAAGTFDIGEELTVNRMGFGAMRLTGPGVWGERPEGELLVPRAVSTISSEGCDSSFEVPAACGGQRA